MSGFIVGAIEIVLAVQVAQPGIVGTVRDGETGEPLAGAYVALTDLDRVVAADGEGRYLLREVPPGPQHLTFRFIGYASRTLHALVPREGSLEINVSLRPEPIPLEALEVRPLVEVRGVERGDHTPFPDRGMTIAAVRHHPLLAEPDVLHALGGGEVFIHPESPSGLHIRGGAPDQTAYLLDGIPVFSPYHAAGVFSAWNPDALSQLRTSSSAPAPSLPEALSGAVSALTRTPGPRFRARWGMSTTQARVTVDGPLGPGEAGYLLSLRSGLPGEVVSKREPSYLRRETGDALGKIEAPIFGGRLRLLGYESQNEIDAAAFAEGDSSGPAPRRNVFEWGSRSLGAEWTRIFGGASVRLQAWSAAGDADALWSLEDGSAVELAAARRDRGVLVAVDNTGTRATTSLGARLEWSRTSYRLESDSSGGISWRMSARTPVATAFLLHTRPMGSRTELELGASVAVEAGAAHVGPRARLGWAPSAEIRLSGSVARLHQFAQSLRNPESPVGTVFPADLYIGVAAPGIPVARSDQGVVAADFRPLAGLRVGIQAYARGLDGLLLVAPRDGEPFSTGGFTTGSESSLEVSLDAALSHAQYGIVASYGWQRVRLEYGDSSYIPQHGTAHRVDAGVIFFPSATASIRLGVAVAAGRRTTRIADGLEWEACNLLDKGCEFAGSPHLGTEPLGAAMLPLYWRVDVGARKHWHVEVAGRDALIGLFGTITNVFGRANVLTYARDPSTGELVEIEMLPLAPLVVGLDGQF